VRAYGGSHALSLALAPHFVIVCGAGDGDGLWGVGKFGSVLGVAGCAPRINVPVRSLESSPVRVCVFVYVHMCARVCVQRETQRTCVHARETGRETGREIEQKKTRQRSHVCVCVCACVCVCVCTPSISTSKRVYAPSISASKYVVAH